MGQIGGSQRVRDDLARALETGRKVTAKVQWISRPANDTRPRWIHCTPLLGVNGLIAVWMVILVNDTDDYLGSREDAPVEPTFSNRSNSAAVILPWTNIEEPSLSGDVRDLHSTNTTSPSASQSSIGSQHGRRAPSNTVTVPPERNRLRKERQSPDKLPSGSSKAYGASAVTSPFASSTDVRYNVSIWSEKQDQKQSASTEKQLKLGKPRFGEPPDGVGSQIPLRPGPRINGKAYSFNSNSEHGISPDDDSTRSNDGERPLSRSSSVAPTRGTGPPIHSPSNSSGQSRGDDRLPIRKTYKSLSPYGILFDN